MSTLIMQRLKVFAAGLAMLLLLASCGSNAEMTTDESKRMQELGEEFVAQIDELLPLRESLQDLLKQDAVVAAETKTYNIQVFHDFYEDYKVGSNAELLTIFSTKSFVVSKIVFEGENGYYFRYEYDPLNPDSIVVTPQLLDRVEVAVDDKLNKIELTLLKEKKSNIVFTYKNIEQEE